MEYKKVFSILGLCSILLTNISYVEAASMYKPYTNPQTYNSQPQQRYRNNQPLYGKVIVVPMGVTIPAYTSCELNTQNMSAGQNISLNLNSDFYFNGVRIAPAGSYINGNAIIAKKAGRAGTNGQLSIRFTNIMTPNGQMIPISGKLKTEDGSGILIGGTAIDTAKDYAKDIAVGSAAGALAGVIISPMSGGKIGKGTALGTAVGAGGGLAKSLWDRGRDVQINANSIIEIVLDQPLTYTPCN